MALVEFDSFIRRQKERSPPKPPCCRCDDRDFFGAPGCARVRGRRDPDCLRNGDAIDGLIGRTNDVGAERGYVRRDFGALCSLACRDRVRSNCAERGGTWADRSGADLAAAARIFRDFRWFGSGAGTYSELIPIYVDAANDGTGLFSVPPKALSILVELGIPLSLLTVALVLVLAGTLISAIARDGHDSTHAILGCSALVYVTTCAFTPSLSISFPTMVVAATMIGLGLAQAKRPRPIGVIPLPAGQPKQDDRKLNVAPTY